MSELFLVGGGGACVLRKCNIDKGNGIVTASGNVDPPIIIKMLKKVGKNVELFPSEAQLTMGFEACRLRKAKMKILKMIKKQKKGQHYPQVTQVGRMQESRLPLLNHMHAVTFPGTYQLGCP